MKACRISDQSVIFYKSLAAIHWTGISFCNKAFESKTPGNLVVLFLAATLYKIRSVDEDAIFFSEQ